MPPLFLLSHLCRPDADVPHRLVREAARIFADKGFDAASTRAICQAASANVAAIHYHFGDKAGLYRAVLKASIDQVTAALPTPEALAALPIEQALHQWLRAFLSPLSGGEITQWFTRIHLRETLEPTPMMQTVIGEFVVPQFQHLVEHLARHCGLAEPDDELRRLAFAITALMNDYCLSQHWMQALAPGLLAGDDALARTLDRLTGYAHALVQHEVQRRQAAVAAGSAHPNPLTLCSGDAA